MKYIRTKEGIYETNNQPNPGKEFQFQWINNFDVIWKTKPLEWIIGDTIEELCDMFVVWLEGRNMPVEMPLSEKEQYEKMKKVVLEGIKEKMNIWLKLAIWTEKGLIYVAKMNDKGEFELIW